MTTDLLGRGATHTHIHLCFFPTTMAAYAEDNNNNAEDMNTAVQHIGPGSPMDAPQFTDKGSGQIYSTWLHEDNGVLRILRKVKGKKRRDKLVEISYKGGALWIRYFEPDHFTGSHYPSLIALNPKEVKTGRLPYATRIETTKHKKKKKSKKKHKGKQIQEKPTSPSKKSIPKKGEQLCTFFEQGTCRHSDSHELFQKRGGEIVSYVLLLHGPPKKTLSMGEWLQEKEKKASNSTTSPSFVPSPPPPNAWGSSTKLSAAPLFGQNTDIVAVASGSSTPQGVAWPNISASTLSDQALSSWGPVGSQVPSQKKAQTKAEACPTTSAPGNLTELLDILWPEDQESWRSIPLIFDNSCSSFFSFFSTLSIPAMKNLPLKFGHACWARARVRKISGQIEALARVPGWHNVNSLFPIDVLMILCVVFQLGDHTDAMEENGVRLEYFGDQDMEDVLISEEEGLLCGIVAPGKISQCVVYIRTALSNTK